MRAIVVRENAALLVDVPAPEPREGEALVAIEAAAVSPLDLQVIAGDFHLRPPTPFVPGTDACGRVVVGDGAALGRRVWISGEGVGVTRDGCWAERAVVPVEALHPLAETVDAAIGASFFVPCSTAWLALFEIGGFEAGCRVGVRGAAGAVGSVAVQMAVIGGASEVIGIVATEERLVAVPAGARPVVARDDAALARFTHADVDVLVDTVGGSGLGASLGMMASGGRMVVVGYVAGTSTTIDLLDLLARDVSIHPLNGINREEDAVPHAVLWLEDIAAGRLDLPLLRFPLDAFDGRYTVWRRPLAPDASR